MQNDQATDETRSRPNHLKSVRDRVWFVPLYGVIDRTGAQTMLYLTYPMICSVDLAHYGVSRAKRLGICVLWYNWLYVLSTVESNA